MSWVLIAVVAGSIVVSGHDTKEACMGRVATLAEQKIKATCVEAPRTTSGILYLSPATNCSSVTCNN